MIAALNQALSKFPWVFALPSIVTALVISAFTAFTVIMSARLKKQTAPVSLPQAYILHSSVTHGRYLPVESKHAFTYPALFMFVSLKGLEAGGLDIGLAGWAFGYGKPKRRVVSIVPRGYLRSGREGEGTTIIERLEDLLRREEEALGLVDDLKLGESEAIRLVEDSWMLTMPSFVGWEGINPLTVYFVYSRAGGTPGESVWTFVVLEIHNTFGESHVYVLKVGEGEDSEDQRGRGYNHQWTFPRQFHVSPFNDRSGYYTVGVRRPIHPPSLDRTSSDPAGAPNPAVRVQLYTPQLEACEGDASSSTPVADLRGELKLSAVLRSTAAIPLTGPGPLLRSLMKMPFDLLLTMVRIHYQAWVLHYGKPRLDVYLRPEMKWPSLWGRGRVVNGNIEKKSENGGGIKWLGEGWLERYARWRVERFLRRRVDEVEIKVTLAPANPAVEVKSWVPESMQASELGDGNDWERERHLRIEYLSSKLFTTLFFSPSAEHALLLGNDTEQWFQVSSRHLFINVFARGKGLLDSTDPGGQSCLQRLRMRPIPSTSAVLQDTANKKDIPMPIPPHHFLDRPATGEFSLFGLWDYLHLLDFSVISLQFFLDEVERVVFSLAKARVVSGQEPWLLWEKAARIYWGKRESMGHDL